MQRSERITLIALCVLAVVCAAVWAAVIDSARPHTLTVSFLDVGQGDAVFIESPGGRQVLIDGGQGGAVLRQLSRRMPWYDRTLDLVVGTHADTDHIGGLIDLLPRYRVSSVALPSTPGESAAWRSYVSGVERERDDGASVREVSRGERIDVGGAYLDVLFPDRPLPGVETNTGCIVMRLVYGETAFMLPCDAPDEIERYMIALGTPLRSSVLKAGHHGSKTSSAAVFIDAVDPEYVVYSRGCENTYGHPAPEVVARFNERNIKSFDTCLDGTVTFVSDGQSVQRQ